MQLKFSMSICKTLAHPTLSYSSTTTTTYMMYINLNFNKKLENLTRVNLNKKYENYNNIFLSILICAYKIFASIFMHNVTLLILQTHVM